MLTVYRASAGAGKTHKLTGEYLKLLFAHPGAYRRILAVTFTNKATDEMKSRILEELHSLATGRTSLFIEDLSSTYALTKEKVRGEAAKILIQILHDYTAFNISTIDRFFQQTMRAFTREIGLQGGYAIEMDQTLVLTEAVDRLLADLEKTENKDLLNWLLRFAEDKIEQGGEWDLRREIMGLGKELFKENYKAFRSSIDETWEDKKTLEAYNDELIKIVQSVESEAKRLGEKGLALIDEYGLQPTDFKGGNRSSMLFFRKLANGEMKEPSATFYSFADNPEGCYTKTTPEALRQIIACVMDGGLNDCIKAVISLFSNLTAYYTAHEITRYYYTLGILTDISRQIALYREEKNVLLIADTTELLNKIIAGSDTPFIYEKTGTQVDHYMIDEFQDTSKMQWDNFRPLLKESLAQSYANLIVGDVKQSIYRFRNSDWTLLDTQIHRDFSSSQLQEEILKENWRSLRRIVEFNNAFFEIAPDLLQQFYNEQINVSSLNEDEKAEFISRIHQAYDKSSQSIPEKLAQEAGHVQITFLCDNDETTWQEESLNRLPAIIEQLQDNGYQLKEIAILVRTNKEGASAAEQLLNYKESHTEIKYKYDIISDEALFVNHSQSVRFIISLLRYLKQPEDQNTRQLALFSYAALQKRSAIEKDIENFPEETERQLRQLSQRSLYEMTEGLYSLFTDYFPKNEQVFIQAFLDLIQEFTQKESVEIGRFLKWWDETGSKKTINTPNEQNAIRIMTIHKSKGLGFKAVIIPFCNWDIDHKPIKPVILWCRPEITPFNRLPLVPVRYGQILSNTYFAKDYFKEKLHAFIDNLNTLYVAFTRAKEELIVLTSRPPKAEETGLAKGSSIADLLWAGIQNVKDILPQAKTPFNKEKGAFEFGEWHKTPIIKESTDYQELEIGQLHSVPSTKRLHLRLRGRNLKFDDEQRKHGALMHDLLSKIYTLDDIPSAVDYYLLAGIINPSDSETLKSQIQKYLADEKVKKWYDGSWITLNETDILIGKGLSKRPDRIMIRNGEVLVLDYKFGEKEEDKYKKQVKNYIELIKAIGYQEVHGYIWYVELDRLVHVNE
ncbi:MAG: UvrD-helicase domain-containing protein [Massilibacteroides sp.]|nr:UvrD-helicase domain-containing protein [Massilibacteroides sp.]